MTVSGWVQDAVFYQIFPDRFANGDTRNDPPGVQPWGTSPTVHQFQGGDLRGVIDHLDYIADLGANAVYFNPIFEATSTHRYDTIDYYRIDRKLGTLDEFKELLAEAHARGIKVVLDGVFNHCGRGFFAFHDLLENEENSGYRDWFHVKRFPLNAYTPGKAVNYEAWWGYKALPKFNTDHLPVRQMILDVAKYWVELGIDGWRLDVPNEIDDDIFWAEFRQVVKHSNPDAYILGEIWDANPRWVGDRHFDGLMNYPVRTGILQLLNGGINGGQFVDQMEKLFNTYPQENVLAMYVPLGSHDTERISTMLNDDQQKIKLAFLLQFCLPGAPAVYYGDEIGVSGGKDPDCRKAFPWNKDEWDCELREYIKHLISIRKRLDSLRRGGFKRLLTIPDRGALVFERVYQGGRAVIAINASDQIQTIELNRDVFNENQIHDLISGKTFDVNNQGLQIQLTAWSGVILG